MFESSKVLVAGATGLIGSYVARALIERGAVVRGTYRSSQPFFHHPKMSYMQADLTNRSDCAAAVDGMDYVFLCAANTSGAAVMVNNPLAHITENILINAQMLEAAALGGVKRFLYISSTTVYPPGPQAVQEDEGFIGDPHDAYFGVGWMKRYGEKLAEFYHRKFDMDIAIVRPSNAYGPYDEFDPERSHVLPALIRRAVEKEDPFVVWGDGSAQRDFIYIDDLAVALLEALERCSDCVPINVGSGRLVSIRDAVTLILKAADHAGAEVVFDASKPETIKTRRLDLTRCKSVLGEVAPTSLEEGLSETIDWYRSTLGHSS